MCRILPVPSIHYNLLQAMRLRNGEKWHQRCIYHRGYFPWLKWSWNGVVMVYWWSSSGQPTPCAEKDEINVLVLGASQLWSNYPPLFQRLLPAHKVVLNSPSPCNKNIHPLIFLRGSTHQKVKVWTHNGEKSYKCNKCCFVSLFAIV